MKGFYCIAQTSILLTAFCLLILRDLTSERIIKLPTTQTTTFLITKPEIFSYLCFFCRCWKKLESVLNFIYLFFILFYFQVKSVDKSVQGTFVLKSGTDFRQFSVVTVDFSTLATKPVVSIFLTSKY